jgi:thiol-disulfide isomerase/thioredoxin
MLNYDNAAYSLHEFRPENHQIEESLYDKDFDYYLDQIDRTLQRRMAVACIDTLLSDDVKDIVIKDFSLLFYSFNILDYKSQMRSNYMDINAGKIPDSLEIQTPTMELYSSLKKLNLNDPQYLYSLASLPEYFMPAILYNDILNIPRIADTPIDVWLGQVRTIMSDVVGFDEGLFYDLLVSNSYGRQLTIETTPLTQKQIENIKAYYRGGEIEKILFRKNDAVVKLASGMGNVVINETPAVPAEEVLDAIISKYKGKIVLVDLWATWCGPCIAAMDKIRPLKSELKDRVVFVYITNASSERKLWDEMTRGIDGEHYFLEDESAWEYIMETNELEYIPSYLLYDKEGTLQNKIEAFPGAEVLREKIEALAE